MLCELRPFAFAHVRANMGHEFGPRRRMTRASGRVRKINISDHPGGLELDDMDLPVDLETSFMFLKPGVLLQVNYTLYVPHLFPNLPTPRSPRSPTFAPVPRNGVRTSDDRVRRH